MSKRCAVLNCPNARRKEKNSVHFFRFPKMEIIMAKWIEATGRENWTPKECSSICEIHFTPEDYSNNNNRKRLRQDVVPTKYIYARSIMENEDMQDTLEGKKCCILTTVRKNSLVGQVEQKKVGLHLENATINIAETVKNKIRNIKEREASNTTQIGKRTNFNLLEEIQKKIQKLEEETNNLKEDLQLLITKNCSLNEYLKRQSIKRSEAKKNN